MVHKNRWLIALSAIAVHVSIGSAYAYSVFKKPLAASLGWSSTETSLAFTLAIFFLGLSAAVLGPRVERWGPRVSALAAAVLFASGQIISGLGVAAGMLPVFYLGYGVVGGVGLGIGYLAPVSTLVRWFPDRRGLATGMAVMGFGAGALLASPVATRLIEAWGVPPTFYAMGTAYLVVMALGARYLERPPEGWQPPGATSAANGPRAAADLAQLSAREAVRTPRFWMLWLLMFVNISAGILLISVAAPLAQETGGLSAAAAAAMVGVMGLFNGGGRIGWSALSDYAGRMNVFTLFFAVQLVLFGLLPSLSGALALQAVLFTVVSMYGGGFALLPAFIADLFGTRELGAILGRLLTAWSVAGIAGPMAAAAVRDATGSYALAFHLVAALLVVALATSFLLRHDVARLRLRAAVAA